MTPPPATSAITSASVNTAASTGQTTATDTVTGISSGHTARAGEPVLLRTVPKARLENLLLWLFVIVPFTALVAAVPLLWGRGLSWVDLGLGVVFFALTSHGITIGFHRLFTHSSFKANRPLKIALAIAGSLAVEGSLAQWVADHRKHHKFSDAENDPHSPWLYGGGLWGLTKGAFHSHLGWLFESEQTPPELYAPDIVKDKDLMRISRLFGLWVAVSLLAPALLGGLLTWSIPGALSAFFWASLVRLCLVHHVTWSVNSVCHIVGARPFDSRDMSGNVWWLAILSAGESWHNAHHAEPTAARHGVLRGQIDSSARLIAVFEWFGWATNVRWPRTDRLRAKAQDARAVHRLPRESVDAS